MAAICHRTRVESVHRRGRAGGHGCYNPRNLTNEEAFGQSERMKTDAFPPAGQVTALLLAWHDGDGGALDALIPIVHSELRRLARYYMRRERPGQTLQPTALVNEAYLRLVGVQRVRWQSRAHFLAVAARLMRRVLVDVARSRDSLKRGGGARTVTFDERFVLSHEWSVNLRALDEALALLAAKDERKSQVVELRFFGGLSVEDTAEALHTSTRTVMRDWRLARAWLSRELARGQAS